MPRPKDALSHEHQHGMLAGEQAHHPLPGEDGAARERGPDLSLPQQAPAQVGVDLAPDHVKPQRLARQGGVGKQGVPGPVHEGLLHAAQAPILHIAVVLFKECHVGFEPAHAGVPLADEALKGLPHIRPHHDDPHVPPYLQPAQGAVDDGRDLPRLRKVPGERQEGGPLKGQLGGQGSGEGVDGGKEALFLRADHGHLPLAAPVLAAGRRVLVEQEHEPVGQGISPLHAYIQHVAVLVQGHAAQAPGKKGQEQQEK